MNHREEEMKHKKKKPSSVSSSKKRSNHKHQWRRVIFRSQIMGVRGRMRDTYSIGKICEICGREDIVKFFVTKPTKAGRVIVTDLGEIKEVEGDLEVIDIGG